MTILKDSPDPYRQTYRLQRPALLEGTSLSLLDAMQYDDTSTEQVAEIAGCSAEVIEFMIKKSFVVPVKNFKDDGYYIFNFEQTLKAVYASVMWFEILASEPDIEGASNILSRKLIVASKKKMLQTFIERLDILKNNRKNNTST